MNFSISVSFSSNDLFFFPSSPFLFTFLSCRQFYNLAPPPPLSFVVFSSPSSSPSILLFLFLSFSLVSSSNISYNLFCFSYCRVLQSLCLTFLFCRFFFVIIVFFGPWAASFVLIKIRKSPNCVRPVSHSIFPFLYLFSAAIKEMPLYFCFHIVTINSVHTVHNHSLITKPPAFYYFLKSQTRLILP